MTVFKKFVENFLNLKSQFIFNVGLYYRRKAIHTHTHTHTHRHIHAQAHYKLLHKLVIDYDIVCNVFPMYFPVY